MATNSYINKVVKGDTAIIDLTGDTVTAASLAQGYTAHDASGAPITGTMSGGTEDGHVYQDAQGYVVLDDESGKTYQAKTVTYTPSESQQTATVTADSGYDALSSVGVTVDAVSNSYVGSGVTRRSSTDLSASGATVSVPAGYYASAGSKSVVSGYAGPPETITETGASISSGTNTITLTKSASIAPDVVAGYVSEGTEDRCDISLTALVNTRSSSDLTASGATVTAPAGYYAAAATKSVSSMTLPTSASGTSSGTSKATIGRSTSDQYINIPTGYNSSAAYYKVSAVANGTAGTPTATKGTVSNHSISVTPSVTNTTGYISGSTKTGTAVTVSASELVSGTKEITANGTGIDVTEYAAVDVAVPSSTPTLITKSITANGTYNASSDSADGYSSVTVNVSGGGGGGDMSDPIRFFDYDGTLVASYSSVPASLPSVPTHTGLTSGTWNYTLQQVQTQFNATGTCDVGANYTTTSGATEIDIELQAGRLHPYLSLAVNGTVSIDWGDNSTPDSVTGTSLTTRLSTINHEYSQAGSYTIKISKTSGTGYSLYCTSTYTLLNKNSSTANANRVYSNCVKAARVGADCAIGNNAFYNCYSLESVSIPSVVTSIGGNAFNSCYSLASVTIPSDVTTIGTNAFSTCYSLASVSIPSTATSISTYAFSTCYSLASVSIPSTVTSIGSNAFYYCYSLESVTIPSGVTSIGSSAFNSCFSLESVTIPSGVTSIGSSAFNSCYSLTSLTIPSGVTPIPTKTFQSCYGMAEYHFTRTESVPTLDNVDAFGGIQSDCVIYVPSSKLNDYKTAENWSTYASYMVGE